MNWRRGFLRLWVVASALWIAAVWLVSRSGDPADARLAIAVIPPLAVMLGAALAWTVRYLLAWAVRFLCVAAGALAALNASELNASDDVQELRRDIARAGNVERAIETSDTRLGRLIRQVTTIQNETNERVQAVWAETDDPALTSPLLPPAVTDPSQIAAAQRVIELKLPLARAAMSKVETLIREERQRIEDSVQAPNTSTRRRLLKVLDERHARMRALLTKYADLNIRALMELSATLGVLSSQSGRYRVAGEDTIIFDDADAVRAYNVHLSALHKILAEEQALEQEMARETESPRARWFAD
ncbi:MAG: hypothetical protein JO021_17350 [Alphaproteobacteria bacterium]|nr:hypothetical protein [Alphaproteobacteria bacterium]